MMQTNEDTYDINDALDQARDILAGMIEPIEPITDPTVLAAVQIAEAVRAGILTD